MSLRTFLHPHHVGNFALATVFFPLKTIPPLCYTLFTDCQLELREWELLTFLGCVIVMKNRKTSTYSGYIRTVVMMAKMLSLVLFMRHEFLYGCLYALLCVLHLIMLPEPCYRGPQKVTIFRGPNMQAELERDKRVTWLIEMHASWSPVCSHFSPVFAELSQRFTLDNLKFGKIDVNRFPQVAKQFNIDTSTWSKQLPTIILFQQGKEVKRRPLVDSKGRVVNKFNFTKESVLGDFQLTDLHMTCKKNPLPNNKKKKEGVVVVVGGGGDGGGVVGDDGGVGDGGGGVVGVVGDGGVGVVGGGGDGVVGGDSGDGDGGDSVVGGGASNVSDGGGDFPMDSNVRLRNKKAKDDNDGNDDNNDGNDDKNDGKGDNNDNNKGIDNDCVGGEEDLKKKD